ncbi:glutamine--fructose-6-phosphate transaminase (isomerizing) [archaeon]|jgi:glutamine---fructose-6-phosphate transaminase (isomerizing)|nr:glutamine--fructose-6-phosphate transaminase (isomerizing) [archaeon]
MCGIIGYIGKEGAKDIILNALLKLEYRGYDSSGISIINEGEIITKKAVGRIKNLKAITEDLPESNMGISHTRWATHGKVTEANAHPHTGCNNQISLVHNGIIENYTQLRKILKEKGHIFKSETDTEVITHLIEEMIKEGNDIETAFIKTLKLLEGAYAIAMINRAEPNKIYAARKSSPLVLGIKEGEYMLASDTLPILPIMSDIIYIHDGDILTITKDSYKIQNLDQVPVNREITKIKADLDEITKGDFPHYMLKEIHEQPKTITNAFSGRIDEENSTAKFGGLNIDEIDLKKIDRVILTGCGTSWHACQYGKYLFEDIARIPSIAEYASEFRYRKPALTENTLLISLSQSGETADTIAAIEEAKKFNVRTIGIVNTIGSTIARMVDGGIYLHAGTEIGVASTKTFNSHLVILYLLSVYLARLRNTITKEKANEMLLELKEIPKKVEEILENETQINNISEKYFNVKNALYLGRGYNFPVALEGALKLKEISYIHAEGYPAAEMKHGPIALIDKDMPTIAIAPMDRLFKKVQSNIEEVQSRGGKVITITTEDIEDHSFDEIIKIPKTSEYLMPILATIPTQLLAYQIAVKRGCDIDKPRNLAKSVTVE